MHPNETLLRDFYAAFSRREGVAMGAAYHDEAKFWDPVFVGLDAEGVRAMWHMLTERGSDLKVEASAIHADSEIGSARWEARYTFSTTGRQVHNVVDASFRFRDGKIVSHIDSFDFWRWSRQALGASGLLLGWTPLLRNKVRGTAMSQLQRWQKKHPLGG